MKSTEKRAAGKPVGFFRRSFRRSFHCFVLFLVGLRSWTTRYKLAVSDARVVLLVETIELLRDVGFIT